MTKTQYEAITTKGMLFGCESDLKLDRYFVLNMKKGERATAERLTEDSMRFNSRDEAINEAQLCVVEQGRKHDRFIVYAVRTNRLEEVEQWESIACCEKRRAA